MFNRQEDNGDTAMTGEYYEPGLIEELYRLLWYRKVMEHFQTHWTYRFGFDVKLDCPTDCPFCRKS